MGFFPAVKNENKKWLRIDRTIFYLSFFYVVPVTFREQTQLFYLLLVFYVLYVRQKQTIQCGTQFGATVRWALAFLCASNYQFVFMFHLLTVYFCHRSNDFYTHSSIHSPIHLSVHLSFLAFNINFNFSIRHLVWRVAISSSRIENQKCQALSRER